MFGALRHVYEVLRHVYEVLGHVYEVPRHVYEALRHVYEVLRHVYELRKEMAASRCRNEMPHRLRSILWHRTDTKYQPGCKRPKPCDCKIPPSLAAFIRDGQWVKKMYILAAYTSRVMTEIACGNYV
ncbi:hypothetical protein E2P81_ATG02127 [Venturia nashicola]|nr:hypothetical protein E2P81_ATG02127 [Venturia nashicola]